MKPLRDNRGFTLVELIVVMAIFIVVMMVTAGTFEIIRKQVSQQSKVSETLVEGIVGLEVLRSDLKHAGFGLPWSFQATPAYTEAASDIDVPAAGFWPAGLPTGATSWVSSFNDANNPPRAIQSANTLFNSSGVIGSKYLVIKSMLVGAGPSNTAAKKWTNVYYAGGAHRKQTWDNEDRDLAGEDRVVVVKNSLNTNPPTQQLMVNSTAGFFATFGHYTTLIQPHQDGDTFEVYGVNEGDLRMPFNRADYYIKRPDRMPTDCAPNTGILYKATLNHSDDAFTEMPLLDCVADMQVVYGLDTAPAGFINSHTTVLPGTAQLIRDQLREIRVYILSHEGKKDTGYSYPSPTINVGESFGGTVQGRTFNLSDRIGTSYTNYRWKVHTIIVRPTNLF